MRTDTLRIAAFVQAAVFALLSLISLGIFGLGLLFAVSDAPDSPAGRHDVQVALGLVALVVLVPCVVTGLFLWAGVRLDRSPRSAAIVLLIAEASSSTFVLWPALHPWIFGLRPAALATELDLVLTVPATVLAAVALTRSTDDLTSV